MTEVIYDPVNRTYKFPDTPAIPASVIEDAHTLRKFTPNGGDTAPEPLPVIMQFFGYQHLPEHLQATSKPFYDLAHVILCLPNNAERAVALRKLLEAKDAAVRAKISK